MGHHLFSCSSASRERQNRTTTLWPFSSLSVGGRPKNNLASCQRLHALLPRLPHPNTKPCPDLLSNQKYIFAEGGGPLRARGLIRVHLGGPFRCHPARCWVRSNGPDFFRSRYATNLFAWVLTLQPSTLPEAVATDNNSRQIGENHATNSTRPPKKKPSRRHAHQITRKAKPANRSIGGKSHTCGFQPIKKSYRSTCSRPTRRRGRRREAPP